MLLTITTTHQPATDLGYLLHKNPTRVHSRSQSYGTAHVFYPEARPERCTAALFVEVDPVGMVRTRRGPTGPDGLLDQYVNDRPYAASSFLSAAISEVFGSALNGRCTDRPELAEEPIPLEFTLPTLPCRGGEPVLRSFFEPLGYEVTARRIALDPRFPSWGDSQYFDVTLRTTAKLHAALSHIYVLMPVLDNSKHYWVGHDEVEKLLKRGEAWLPSHPQKELIVRRYLKHKRSLADLALERLVEGDGEVEDTDAEESLEVVRGDSREQALEKGLSLNDQRMAAVTAAVQSLQPTAVIDLGCGEGKLLKQLLPIKSVTRLMGVDVSHRALEIAQERLNIERLPRALQEKISLVQGSLIYRDTRFDGFDMATVIEVIEHLDKPRLSAFSRVLFEYARPGAVVMTTPNREYNVKFAGLKDSQLRHSDHRFEWTREEFSAWANEQCGRFGYDVRFEGIGPMDETLGAPTQMAVFTRKG